MLLAYSGRYTIFVGVPEGLRYETKTEKDFEGCNALNHTEIRILKEEGIEIMLKD